MKAQPYREEGAGYIQCEPHEATHIAFCTPGPFLNRLLPVILHGSRDKSERKPVWTWNGDTEKPTLKPSILTTNGSSGVTCHTWITDGKVQFLDDCTHEFKGQTLDLLDVNA